MPGCSKHGYHYPLENTTWSVNPLSPNSDLSKISHCSIKGLLVREAMRIENMITQVPLIF